MLLLSPWRIITSLSYNSKRSLLRALIVGIITVPTYIFVVVITTPNLPPLYAINTTLQLNSPIIFGTTAGISIQSFISSYLRGIGSCRLERKQGIDMNASTGGTVFSSFLSFFSLVPVGCCGSWLFILSLLPSVFGGTLAAVMIKYSILLSYIGLSIVLVFTFLSVLRFYHVRRGRG